MALRAPGAAEQTGVSATCWPTGNSDTSVGPAEPMPARTTLPGTRVMPPPAAASTTVPVRGTFGASGPGWSSRTLTS